MHELNNEHLIKSLVSSIPIQLLPRQSRIPSHLILPKRLPSVCHLNRLASQSCDASRHSAILSLSLASAIETPVDALPPPTVAKKPSSVPTSSEGRRRESGSVGLKRAGKYEDFEVRRAIERKNIMFLMELRDSQFELLVQSTGGSTPLLHALRLGPSHKEVAIVLVGAISRRVNEVTDEELETMTPYTRSLLRAIRANLQLAISYSLASSQPFLISSFLQVIIMCEGDRWILSSAHKTALALRSGKVGRPVHSASVLFDKWVSRELKEEQIAGVADYRANAISDLVVLGLWSIVEDKVHGGEKLPTYFYARDDRMSKAVEERVEMLQRSGDWNRKLPKALREQIFGALTILHQRNLGSRQKLDELERLLDAT